METKYVIIMHNAEGHTFEESPLLDNYPKPEMIEYYLNQGKYSFAKVEKRYALENINEVHVTLNTRKPSYEAYYLTEDGIPGFFSTHDELEFKGFILNLKEQDIPYETIGDKE